MIRSIQQQGALMYTLHISMSPMHCNLLNLVVKVEKHAHARSKKITQPIVCLRNRKFLLTITIAIFIHVIHTLTASK